MFISKAFIVLLNVLARHQASANPYPSQASTSPSVVSTASASPTQCAYPSQSDTSSIFQSLERNDITTFSTYLVPNVTWTVEGTHPLAGTYHSRDTFINDTILRVAQYGSLQDPLKTSVVNIIGGCSDSWAAIELAVIGTMKNGLYFDDRYSWNCNFNEQGLIFQARAYLDSELVAKAIVTNEVPFYTFNDTRS